MSKDNIIEDSQTGWVRILGTSWNPSQRRAAPDLVKRAERIKDCHLPSGQMQRGKTECPLKEEEETPRLGRLLGHGHAPCRGLMSEKALEE